MDSLPDGVISHILSFRPTKKSALTSVLSKRWRNLFTFSPNLELECYTNYRERSFVDFTDRLLSASKNATVKNISLKFHMSLDQAHINRWTRDVLNRGVLEFKLIATTGNSLPFEVFTCKTLVKLNLSCVSINEVPEDAFLPALKTLILNSVQFCRFRVCPFDKLLSACPVLEDLNIRDLKWGEWKRPRVLSSPSLLRLTIGCCVSFCCDGIDSEAIVFDTPNVIYLNYHGCASGSYRIVCLDSLVEANLTLDWSFLSENDSGVRNPKKLIKGLKNVKIMNLLSRDSLEIFYCFREAIPVYENCVIYQSHHCSHMPGEDCHIY